MDNINQSTIEEIERAIEPIVEVLQDFADAINEAVCAFVEYMERVMIEIGRALDLRLLDLAALYVELQRETLFIRLHERGVPAWLARWIASHCPLRWLPSRDEVGWMLYNG